MANIRVKKVNSASYIILAEFHKFKIELLFQSNRVKYDSIFKITRILQSII